LKVKLIKKKDLLIIVALDDTPGPTAYDPAVALSLLNQDPNKHYGFLEKSTRWKSLSKGKMKMPFLVLNRMVYRYFK
jgi:hypothetical protein